MKSKEFRRLARENMCNRWGKFALITFLYVLFAWLISMAANSIPLVGPIALYAITPIMAFGFINQMILLKNGANVDNLDFLTLGFKRFKEVWKVFGWTLLKCIGPMILSFVAMVIIVAGMIGGIIFSLGTSEIEPDYPQITMEDISNPEEFAEIQYHTVTTAVSEMIMTGIILFGTVLAVAATIWFIPLSYKYAFVYYDLVMNPNMNAKDLVEFSGQKMMGNRWRYFKLTFSFTGWCLLACLGFGIPMFWIYPYMMIASIFFYESISNTSVNNVQVSNDGPITY